MTELPNMNRRAVLVGSVATAFMAAGAGLAAYGPTSVDTFHAILRRLIGPFQMPDQEFSQFVEDFQSASMQLGRLENGAIWFAEKLAMAQLSMQAGLPGTEKFRLLERELLTEFVLATGVAPDPSNQRAMRYSGLFDAQSCFNPFAQFE
jgi:hypothetical protein